MGRSRTSRVSTSAFMGHGRMQLQSFPTRQIKEVRNS